MHVNYRWIRRRVSICPAVPTNRFGNNILIIIVKKNEMRLPIWGVFFCAIEQLNYPSAKYTEKSADYVISYYINYFSDIMFAKSTRNRSVYQYAEN